jgi:hypothetical protein
MINIPHIDLKIWNPEFKTIEIVSELQQHGNVSIGIDGEGSDCETLGLYKLLDAVCSNLGYTPGAISIHTCNQLEHHSCYKIIKHPPLYIPSGQQFASQHTLPEKRWDAIKHFGIFVGRSSWQRLWMASHTWSNYGDITSMTYHYDSSVDYHRTHLSFDELAYQIGLPNAVNTAGKFMQQLPIKNESVDSYPILTPAHFAIAKLYPDFFVEIVCETFLSGNSFYPTEKTWRPFICRTPFLTLGPRGFLANLHKLGFRTFSQWWDESYDQDADLDNGRIAIKCIQQTQQRLSILSTQELEGMYIDMKDTLEHNYQHFMQLKETDFVKIWP